MPFMYSIFKTDKCKCQVVRTGYRCGSEEMEGVTLLTRDRSLYRVLKSNESVTIKHNVISKIIENLYDQCATYNLKYCAIAGFNIHDGYVRNALKDLLIMACFLIANFVVFVTIFAKTLVHVYYVVFAFVQWLGRYCPIRGFTKHNSYISNAMKDLIILACFLIANFVVFITIFTKTLVHLYHVVFVLARWIGRSYHVDKEPTTDAEAINRSVTRLTEAFHNIKNTESNWSANIEPPIHRILTNDDPHIITEDSWVRESIKSNRNVLTKADGNDSPILIKGQPPLNHYYATHNRKGYLKM